jgi:hypothetical protein
MADETFTKADLDKAIKDAVEEATKGLKQNLSDALDEAKDAKRKLRAASEIKPEDLTAAEDRADKAEAALKEAQKAVKDATTAKEKAEKALETEQGAARAFALEAEIASAIASGNVVPALVPAFKAMVTQQAKADMVDGKYSVSIGDKPAKEYIDGFLNSDDGKAFKAAANNSGCGGPGSRNINGSGKSVTQEALDAMNPKERAAHFADGGVIATA